MAKTIVFLNNGKVVGERVLHDFSNHSERMRLGTEEREGYAISSCDQKMEFSGGKLVFTHYFIKNEKVKQAKGCYFGASTDPVLTTNNSSLFQWLKFHPETFKIKTDGTIRKIF